MRPGFSWLFLWICLVGAVNLLAGCGWEPVARPVKPELILEGSIRLEYLLDLHGRFVLVSTEHQEDDEAPRRAYSIVDWKTAERCDLPTDVVRFIPPIFGPTEQRKQSPLFVLPVSVQDGDNQTLQFFDENCRKRGDTDFGVVSNTMQTVALDEDGREVILYGNGMGVVATADPWTDQRVEIASGVRRFAFVQRASMYSAPQMLWLLEDGVLRQRTLDGSLLLSLGERVTDFVQVMYGELRVAFMAGEDVYEAIAPEFIPTRIADSACGPVYRGNTLELKRPCADDQLVRINLQTGEHTEFEKGVSESYLDNGYLFERSHDEKGNHQWVEPPGGKRTEIKQPFATRPLVLNGGLLAGLKDLPVDCTLEDDARDTPEQRIERSRFFVIYDLVGGKNLRVLKGINDFFIFNDNRTSSYVWMVQHNLHVSEDVPEHRLGELALFSERDLRPDTAALPQCDPDDPTAFVAPDAIETIQTEVPERSPLGGTPTGVHGYSIETAVPFPEPLVVVISDAKPLSSNPKLSRGRLEARLLSGELGASIAEDVTSYFLLTTPVPGVLYGVEEGDKPGLWFAAL
jgi:hypothetical protein